MTKVAVVAYPEVDDSERQWLEGVRAAHDPQARLIAAHFTLVFPAEADHGAVIGLTSAVCGVERPIRFTIGRAGAVRDMDGVGGHVFLIPDGGCAEIAALHKRLYDGPLRGRLRSELPFMPHITVGAHADLGRCRALAADIEASGRRVSGTIDCIDVVEVAADGVQSLRTFRLGSVGGR
jgi:2'-5' RNA ligase